MWTLSVDRLTTRMRQSVGRLPAACQTKESPT
jgi:hypothetical protein